MSKHYSLDLRERAAAYAVVHGSASLAAQVFDVSKATVVRWARQLREVGHVMPGEVGGHRLPILRDEGEWLLLRMKQEPHVSLRQLQAELEVRGIIVSYGSVWNFVHSLNQSFKKNSSRRRATKA